MADLNKLLVKVPSDLCDAFRTKYLTGDGSTPRDNSYDKKIVFLEDTKDIFSQGKIYGTSYDDFTQLQNKVNERSVTLTFNVNSFDNINEQGGNGSNAQLHYDAVSKAYDNGGIVKIELNNPSFDENPIENPRNSAILSNIKKVQTVDPDTAYTIYYITGTLCPILANGIVGNNKSYEITFKCDTSGLNFYNVQDYYVSCKEIADTLYNRKFGGGEIQGDNAGTFMEMIAPGNDTLSIVLKQLLTNDVLIKKSLETVEIVFDGVESFGDINLDWDLNSDPSGSHVMDKYNQIRQAYANGKVIKLTLRNYKPTISQPTEPNSAILSNLEHKGWTDDRGNSHTIFKGLLSPYTSSTSFEISFICDVSMHYGDSYHIYCKKNKSFGSAAYEDVSYFDKAGAANEVKRILTGTDEDEGASLSIHGTRKYAKELADTAYSDAKDYTNSVLPTVSKGNNINIETTTDANGKINYEISTTATVFNYKGNKEKFDQLPQLKTENKTGDVWSVGTADTPGSSLYAWDGDEWINIGPADGVVGISPNSSHGISLTLDKNGYLGITAQHGFIGTDDRFVTGETVNSALGNIQREIPHLTYGRGINVSKGTLDGHFAYTVSTTSEIIRYLGDYPDSSQIDFSPESGDAYSMKKVLYRYSGNNQWEAIAGHIGSVSHTYSNGIRLQFDPYVAQLQLIVNTGRIGVSTGSSYNDSYNGVVTGSTVYQYIDSLSYSKTSTNGSHVNVTVSTQGGNVSGVSVTETKDLKDAITNAKSALQSVEVLGKTLNKDSNTITVDEAKTYLGLGSAAYKNESDFDKAGAAASAAATVEKKLPGIINGSGITVTPDTPDANGKITYTISQSINTTAINGVALKFVDSTNALGLSITTGKVSSSKFGDGANLVTGYDVYEALCTNTINDVKPDDTLVIPENYTSYIKTEKHKYTDSSYSYTAITLNMSRVYSYVIDNIWEEYSL